MVASRSRAFEPRVATWDGIRVATLTRDARHVGERFHEALQLNGLSRLARSDTSTQVTSFICASEVLCHTLAP